MNTDRSPVPVPRPIVPPVPQPRAIDADEEQLRQRGRVLVRTADEIGCELDPAGIYPARHGLELVEHGAERWLFASAESDPLVVRNGTMPVPGEMLRKLRVLRSADVDVASIVLAHQLPGRSNKGDVSVAALLPLPGRIITPDEAAQLVPEPTPPPDTARAANRVERFSRTYGRTIALAAAATAAAPLGLVAGLAAGLSDPILFVVLTTDGARPRPGVPAAWFVVGRWDW